MAVRKLVYIVEDDKEVCSLVESALKEHNYDVKAFHTGLDAKRELLRKAPDLFIIDLLLPDIAGLDIVQATLNNTNAGIFILSGLHTLTDRVIGLEIGADDYITKPFETRELVARVNSYFRRISRLKEGIEQINLGQAEFSGCTFDPNQLAVTSAEGNSEALSAREAEILVVLLRSPNKVLSRDQILNLSHPDDLAPYDRSVDIRISRIRKKINDDPSDPRIIKTIYGAGYMLASEVKWQN